MQARKPWALSTQRGLVAALIAVVSVLDSLAQAQTRLGDPKVAGENLQIAGVSRCLSVVVVWSAGLVKAPNVRADGPEIRANNALLEFYGEARRHLIASSGNPAVAGAMDTMVRQQGEYFGNLVRFQGWDAVMPDYRQCVQAAQVGSAAPPASSRPATSVSSAPPSSPTSPPPARQPNSPSQSSSATSSIDGNWYSREWRYGYVLRNGVGKATSTNSPNFEVGQEIIFLESDGNGVFRGRQVYTDGKFYSVTAVLQPNGDLQFSGERNARWMMRRVD